MIALLSKPKRPLVAIVAIVVEAIAHALADSSCPIAETRARLEAMLAAEPAGGGDDRIRQLLENGDYGIVKLCCVHGWSGSGGPRAWGWQGGTAGDGGPNDAGLCWPSGPRTDFVVYSRCCYEDLRRLAAEPPPPWMKSEIASDFSLWSQESGIKRISRASLDDMERDWGHVYCRFRVSGRVVSTCNPFTIEALSSDGGSEASGQYESLLRLTRIFASNDLLPDGLDFFVSPQIYEFLSTPVPVFSKARAVFARGPIRVPSYELLGPWIDKARAQLKEVVWEKTIRKLYWRGGMRSFNFCPCPESHQFWPPRWKPHNMSTLLARDVPGEGPCDDLPISVCEAAQGHCRCHRHVTNATNFPFSNRIRLCELARLHPGLIDAKLSYVPEPQYSSIGGLCTELGYRSHSFSRPEEHAMFRYVISTDGSTIDDTRVYWLLLTGSLLFKQVTSLMPYAVTALHPWTHFIPIREDMSDLPDKIIWARKHDAECKAMAERGKAFAQEYFTELEISQYVLRALLMYNSILEPLKGTRG